MGSQDLSVALTDFEELLYIAGMHDYKREKFIQLADFSKVCSRLSARLFYELLGVEKYTCIDLDGRYGALQIDLNYPLEDKLLYNKYDLVTDYSTNEHVFNTAETFRSMYRLYKPNGLFISAQTIYNGNGYYMYDPSFYEGIAAANSYKVIFSALSVTPKATNCTNNPEFLLPLSRELINVVDFTKVQQIGVWYVMQKLSDADLRYPYQREFLSKKERNLGYQIQFMCKAPGYNYPPINQPENVPFKFLLGDLKQKVIRRLKTYLKFQ